MTSKLKKFASIVLFVIIFISPNTNASFSEDFDSAYVSNYPSGQVSNANASYVIEFSELPEIEREKYKDIDKIDIAFANWGKLQKERTVSEDLVCLGASQSLGIKYSFLESQERKMKITSDENQINFATRCNKFGSGYKEFFRKYTDDLAVSHCKVYDRRAIYTGEAQFKVQPISRIGQIFMGVYTFGLSNTKLHVSSSYFCEKDPYPEYIASRELESNKKDYKNYFYDLSLNEKCNIIVNSKELDNIEDYKKIIHDNQEKVIGLLECKKITNTLTEDEKKKLKEQEKKQAELDLEREKKQAELEQEREKERKEKEKEKQILEKIAEEEAKKRLEPKLMLTGTGFYINENGYIATNWHVTDGCLEMRLDGEVLDIVRNDVTNDLAILKSKTTNTPYIPFSKNGAIKGEDVYVIGYPFGQAISSESKMTKGIVSALQGYNNNINLLQIDAPVQSGNSGGPVLNNQNQLVGIVVSKYDIQFAIDNNELPQNMNYAIKSQVLGLMLDSLNMPYNKEDSISQLSEADKATVYLECWSTELAMKEILETLPALVN